MQCEVCGQGPMQGISVFRTGEKGGEPHWRCEFHAEGMIDPETKEIVHLIEGAGREAH